MQDNDLPQIGTPMQTDETRVEVIQADRDALYAHLNPEGLGGCGCDWAEQLKRGEQDDYSLLQAFARHRQQFAAPEPRTIDPGLAALIRRNTVAGGFANTVAIAEEAFEMGVKSAGPPAVEREGLMQAAINQNDAMRQELAHVGNLVSDLARAMGIDQANADGSWPDLAARVQRLQKAALATPQGSTLHPSDREEGVARALFAALKKCCIGWDKKSYVFGSHEVCEVDGEIHLMSVAGALPAILALSGSLAPEGGESGA